ncbi:LysR substrate-binding domain-containing protein [Rhodococcus sp. TAF43]|uniref:LysR substrate-binding domain-containing protein n=1 Tax=unclassified Rhodococcus (in: high G+C Gram-positive bacteria) TaxID=192944 RepID=UPI0015843418|nr:LysR substrate-binding domain-containing protein [Rhodococcus sp. W8901]QKT11263.1 LysR family transcriptional regulator [Rhodococcus sp. W8901]
MTEATDPRPFRLAYVPGVTPAKWVRIWNERITDTPLELVASTAAESTAALREDRADAALVRLPIDRDGLSAITLYAETPVVVVPKDHVFTAADEIALSDLAEELVLDPLDTPITWDQLPGRPALDRPASTGDAIELVAAGVGVLVVPQSLARLHHRKDLTYRPVAGAPESEVALSWVTDRTTELVEEFIGIVRGRTANSSRGPNPHETPRTKDKAPRAAAPRTAKQSAPTSGKARAKDSRRGKPGSKAKPGGRKRR